ncbi:hypothetical protein C8F04DRAFT_1258650 [Mycena alexandri]|uniref:Uncharacterized protein n=1 Tax=Mycena alexandri TaxID=1745969 RepID=A0AAD6X514_9AGAR|nr:hypothetical protein C8F04DRAFT_1258650 [Mycena alexandri]
MVVENLETIAPSESDDDGSEDDSSSSSESENSDIELQEFQGNPDSDGHPMEAIDRPENPENQDDDEELSGWRRFDELQDTDSPDPSRKEMTLIAQLEQMLGPDEDPKLWSMRNEELTDGDRNNIRAFKLKMMSDMSRDAARSLTTIHRTTSSQKACQTGNILEAPPPDEKEVTLDDFPSPTKKKVTQPKPKSKVKKEQGSNPIPKPTKPAITSVYSTRSKGKVDPD